MFKWHSIKELKKYISKLESERDYYKQSYILYDQYLQSDSEVLKDCLNNGTISREQYNEINRAMSSAIGKCVDRALEILNRS